MQDDPTDFARERLRRSEAAAYVARRLGQTVKVNTLRSWKGIFYRQIGRDAVYELADLDRFIEARLTAAPRRGVDYAALHAERFRLLRSANPEHEAEARAFEFAVKTYRDNHPGCDLGTATTAVRALVAKAKEKVRSNDARRSFHSREAI